MILLQCILEFPEAKPAHVLSLALRRARMHQNELLYKSYITDMLKAIGLKSGISGAYRWYDTAYGEPVEEKQQTPEEVKGKILDEYKKIGGENR